MDWTVTVFQYMVVFLFGLAIGSFLNVVIYRLPRGESIVFPPSRCPDCGTPIRYRDNIPLLGYLLLRGRCRSCNSPISPQYPLIECVVGCMFAALFYLHGPSIPFVSLSALGTILLAATVTDLRHMIIPDRLMIAGGALGFLLALPFGRAGVLRALGGAAAGLAILTVMLGIGWALYRRESIGRGDFKLIAVTGLFLGPVMNCVALFIAVFIGGTWGIALILMRKNVPGREVPFVPFIAAGCYGVMFFGTHFLSFIQQYIRILP